MPGTGRDPRPRRTNRKRQGPRWAREVKAIVLLAAGAFGALALASFDPAHGLRRMPGTGE